MRRVLVSRFYELMDELPEAYTVRRLHPDSLACSADSLFKCARHWTSGSAAASRVMSCSTTRVTDPRPGEVATRTGSRRPARVDRFLQARAAAAPSSPWTRAST